MNWGEKGEGRWITIYTNPGHAFMVIAGLRFDTSMRTVVESRRVRESRTSTRTRTRRVRVVRVTSRWSKVMRPADGYKIRHLLDY
jgi:hypothetical protein